MDHPITVALKCGAIATGNVLTLPSFGAPGVCGQGREQLFFQLLQLFAYQHTSTSRSIFINKTEKYYNNLY